MNSLDLQHSGTKSAPIATRGDLTGFLMQLSEAVDADSYMLAAVTRDQRASDLRIVASNWVWDAVHLTSFETLAAIAKGAGTAGPGEKPRPLVTRNAPSQPTVVDGPKAKLLDVLGHAEIYSLRIHVGRQRLFLILSSEEPGRIDQDGLCWAQMRCCYALCNAPDLLVSAAAENPLSDRESECLNWVSEGKTTDEVAVILGVSSNTVNSYIAHAIQKFSASNRAAALATAIRNGII